MCVINFATCFCSSQKHLHSVPLTKYLSIYIFFSTFSFFFFCCYFFNFISFSIFWIVIDLKDRRKSINQSLIVLTKAEADAVRKEEAGVANGGLSMYQCLDCESKNCTSFQMQTRGAGKYKIFLVCWLFLSSILFLYLCNLLSNVYMLTNVFSYILYIFFCFVGLWCFF